MSRRTNAVRSGLTAVRATAECSGNAVFEIIAHILQGSGTRHFHNPNCIPGWRTRQPPYDGKDTTVRDPRCTSCMSAGLYNPAGTGEDVQDAGDNDNDRSQPEPGGPVGTHPSSGIFQRRIRRGYRGRYIDIEQKPFLP
jgi:hypothetical protein